MPLDNNSVLEFVKKNGLVLPVQLAKEFKQSSILMGAMLSDLKSQNKLIISNTKIGGSPVYYVKENEAKLVDLYKYLNEKDKRAFDLLKEKQILRDVALTPLERVCMRSIKDFAVPVQVRVNDKDEIFWAWYLLPEADIGNLIQGYFDEPKEKPAAKVAAKKEEKEEKKASKEESKQAEKEPDKEEPKGKKGKAAKEEKKEPEETEEEQEEEEETIFQSRLMVEEKAGKAQARAQAQAPAISALSQAPAIPVPKSKGTGISDKLHTKVKDYLEKNQIAIKSMTIVKNHSEIDYMVEVPSSVGKITYYCKAKIKKKISDSDLASAYLKGQSKKLPVLFLTNGEITKKANEMLSTDFPFLRIVKLE